MRDPRGFCRRSVRVMVAGLPVWSTSPSEAARYVFRAALSTSLTPGACDAAARYARRYMAARRRAAARGLLGVARA